MLKRRTEESWPAALEKLRARIAATQAAVQATEVAAVPFEEALARMRRHLDALGAQGDDLSDGLARVLYARSLDPAALVNYLPPVGGVDTLRAFVAAVFRDAVERWATTALQAHAPIAAGMTAAQREAAEARLRSDLRRFEVEEERLILQAAREGVVLDRRPDLDVEVFLTTFDDGAEAAA